MKRFFFFFFILTQIASAQVWNLRDNMNYANGTDLNGQKKWIKFSSGSDSTIVGEGGVAIKAQNQIGQGSYGGVIWDSTFTYGDSLDFAWVWNQNNAIEQTLTAQYDVEMLYGMSSKTVSSWDGYAVMFERWNGSGVNGGDYAFTWHYVVNGNRNPYMTAHNSIGGLQIKQNDTIEVKKTGAKQWVYWHHVGGNTTVIDSATDNTHKHDNSYLAVQLRVSSTPTRLGAFYIISQVPPVPPTCSTVDTTGPIGQSLTQSFAVDTSQSITITGRTTDNDTCAQKNPGIDTLVYMLGYTLSGGHPVGDSLRIYAHGSRDTTYSATFSKKSQTGDLYYQIRQKDLSGNVTYNPPSGPNKVTVGTGAQNPFNLWGYWPYWIYNVLPPSTPIYKHLNYVIVFETNPDSNTNNISAVTTPLDSIHLFGLDRDVTGYPAGTDKVAGIRESTLVYGAKMWLGVSGTQINPAHARDFSAIFSDTARTRIFARNVRLFCQRHRFDGVDFNWEFPVQSDKANMAKAFAIIRDEFNKGVPVPLQFSVTVETQSSNVNNQNYDFSAVDTYADFLTVESSSMLGAYAGSPYAGLGNGIYRPGCASYNNYLWVMSDTTFQTQVVPQYVTVNGMNIAGVRKSKLVQFIDTYGKMQNNGPLGPCDPPTAVSYVQYGDIFNNYYQQNRAVRDAASRATYLSWTDGSGNHYVSYQDSIYALDVVNMMKGRGFANIAFYELANGYIYQNFPIASAPFVTSRDAIYRWYRSAAGNGSSSTIPNIGTPTLVAPANNATQVSTSTQFSWRQATNATQYRLTVSTDVNFGNLIFDQDIGTSITDTTKTVLLSVNTSYYWKVAGKAVGQYGNFSSARIFTTAGLVPPPTNAPSVPTLSSPSNGASSQSSSINLTWSTGTDTVTKIYIQLSNVSNFASFPPNGINDSLVGNPPASLRTAAGLSPLTTYYWRVKASNSVGASAFSSSFNFTTASGPVVITEKAGPLYYDPITGKMSANYQTSSPLFYISPSLWVPSSDSGVVRHYAAGDMYWNGHKTIYDSLLFDPNKSYVFGFLETFNGGIVTASLNNTGLVNSSLNPSVNVAGIGLSALGTNTNPWLSLSANTLTIITPSAVASSGIRLHTSASQSGLIDLYFRPKIAGSNDTIPTFGDLKKDTISKAIIFKSISAVDSNIIHEIPINGATIRSIRAIRTGGTSASINVTKNGTDLLTANYTTTTSLASAGTLQNASLLKGDILRVSVRAVSGTVTEIFVQVVYDR